MKSRRGSEAEDTSEIICAGFGAEAPGYFLLDPCAANRPFSGIVGIDRLGRNYSDILDQWRIITKEKQAAIVVLDMPLLDTRSNRDLTGTLIADIVLQLLSYVAETERAFIRQRQREGIAAAKARGQRFGPPCKKRPENLDQYINQWASGEISAREASRKLHVAHTTFLVWAREDKENRGHIHCEKGTRPVAPSAVRN